MDTEEITAARRMWHELQYPCKLADQTVSPYLTLEAETRWIERARLALFLSRSAFSRIEANEHKTNIETLKRVAEAMECELVYGFRPKSRLTFGREIWKVLCAHALQHPYLRDGQRSYRSLYGVATGLMKRPSFRRERGWHKRVRDGAR